VDFIFFRINEFINSNQNRTEIEIKNQIICLNYLIYRFKIRNIHLTKRLFSKEVIGNLRDNKILITSSQSGYKIPCCKGDLIRFYNYYSSKIIPKIIPMIDTLGKTDIVIRSATSGNINLLENNDYKLLKDLIETAASRQHRLIANSWHLSKK
jgi:hypothetical protein